jgi:hypothetical protein
MSELHFGYQSNGITCRMGCHHGLGDYTPEQRAAMAKRMQEKMPQLMDSEQIAFLRDWEKRHGIVHYRMDVLGKSSGAFDKGQQGMSVMGPVFIDPLEPAQVSQNYRKDIHN